MRKTIVAAVSFCAACLVAAAQAQGSSSSSSPGSSSSSSGGTSDSSLGASGSSSSGSSLGSSSDTESSKSSSRLSPTGRMAQHEVKATELSNSSVKSSSGDKLGTIQDVLVNPHSGRVDFAIISVSEGGTSGTSTSATAGAGKQVAVPWSLLRPSMEGGATATGGQQAFTFTGDQSKLQSAPTFDANTDMSQPGWRQSVFSYFGVSGSSATGGSESSGGSSSGSSGGSSSPGSSSGSSGSSSSSPDSSSGSSSSSNP